MYLANDRYIGLCYNSVYRGTYKREVYMSILERTIQSVIFELGAILIGMLVIEFIPHEGQPLLLMILISLTAVIWNFIFNWVYDRVRLFFVKSYSIGLR